MRAIFTNLILFIVFAITFSGLSACTGTANSQKGPFDEAPAPYSNAPSDTEAPKKSSEYPPIATAVAESDLKNLDGTTFKVTDKKGKVLLLNMWGDMVWPVPLGNAVSGKNAGNASR